MYLGTRQTSMTHSILAPPSVGTVEPGGIVNKAPQSILVDVNCQQVVCTFDSLLQGLRGLPEEEGIIRDNSSTNPAPSDTQSACSVEANNNLEEETGLGNNLEQLDENANISVLPYYDQMVASRSKEFGIPMFLSDETVRTKLISLLNRNGAHLSAYGDVMKWVQDAATAGYDFQQVPPTRQNVIERLKVRVGTEGLTPKIGHLKLPISGKVARIVYFDAAAVFASLLTSPLLHHDDNYLFHENDPFAPPPVTPGTRIGDINDGRCYTASYKTECKHPDDVLMLTPLAIDKTHVDTLGRIKLEPINLSLGIHKRSIRQLSSANRPLGYVSMYFPDDVDMDTIESNANNDQYLELGEQGLSQAAISLNDYHAQLRFIFDKSGFLELQQNGFKWMLQYRGKVHRVTFRVVVPFIVGDTEGHDRLCGHFTARFQNVAQLCRICECPTHLTDYSKAKFPFRVPSKVNARKGDQEELRAISQQNLLNAFDHINFGSHNKRGIFGACCGEILHMIQLGEYKYILEAFFDQVGKDSSACQELKDFLKHISAMLARQSDRDIQRTSFPDGFTTACNLRGHEVGGCLIVLLFALSTNRFASIFSHQKRYTNPGGLGNDDHIKDWCILLIGLLSWEQWLKQDTISRYEASRSSKALRWLMRRMKTVAPRNKCMGYKTPRFHLVTHIQSDILDFGVPQGYNSSYNERNHIEIVKRNFATTQKRKSNVTEQSAYRYVERLTISQAMALMTGDNKTSGVSKEETPCHAGNHYQILAPNPTQTLSSPPIILCKTGTKIIGLSNRVISFIVAHCPPDTTDQSVHCFTEHKRKGEIFRCHSDFMGNPWNDCVVIDWGRVDGKHPALIRCFVDIRNTGNKAFQYCGQTMNEGLFAVLECFTIHESHLPSKDSWDIVVKGNKELDPLTGRPKLQLVSVESFFSPVVAIPEIEEDGNINTNTFLFMKPRSNWSALWSKHIRDMAKYDSESDEEGDPDDEMFDKEEAHLVGKRVNRDVGTTVIADGSKKRGGKKQRR